MTHSHAHAHAKGFGLDYLKASLKATPTLSSSRIPAAGGTTTLSIRIQNSGAVAGAYVVQVYFRQRVAKIARQNLNLANFTKVWLPAAGGGGGGAGGQLQLPSKSAATTTATGTVAEVTVRSEELGYYDSWVGKQTVDTGAINGVYDLFVCSDSSCGCGYGNGVPSCLEKLPHVTLTVHD